MEHIAPHDLRRTCAKLCHSSGGELEQIQFLLGHASVQTTERYLGCKQNLGHPVNDLFDLRTDVQPDPRNLQSGAVKGYTPVEMASRLGIECRHGGSEHDQPFQPCHPERPCQPARFDVVEVRKGHRPQSLDAALKRELHEVIQEAKQMASRIRQSSDLWDLEHYLTQRRREIDRKYDYRYSQLTLVFGKLLRETRLGEEDVRGLREDKLESIRSYARFLAKMDAA